MSEEKVYLPLNEWVDLEKEWPFAEFLTKSIDDVFLSPPEVDPATGKTTLDIFLLKDLSLSIPGLPWLELSISPPSGGTGVVIPLKIQLDPFEISIEKAPLVARIKRDVLQPVKLGSREPDLDKQFTEITLGSVTLSINAEGHLKIKVGAGTKISRCMIGTSGLIIEAGDVQWLSPIKSGDPVPTNIKAPPGGFGQFTGLYIGNAQVDLPDIHLLLPQTVKFEDCYIGTGGFTGKISGSWNLQLSGDKKSFTGDGAGNIFGIPFGLKEIDLEFKQNALVKSKIQGAIIFPFFDQPAFVDIGLTMDGDFTIALSADQTLPLPQGELPQKNADGLFVFTKKDLVKLTVKGLGFERQDGKFSVNMSGSIKPLIRSLDWPEFDVKSLSIDSEGKVRIDGGWINLPNQKGFNLYGFRVDFTKIGFGNEADGARWIGLSGGIKLVDGLPLEGGVEGLRLIWKSPTDIRMAIGGIRVGFEIKDVLKFNGTVVFIDEPTKKGFKGGIKMVLYPLNGCSLDVQLIVGKNTLSPPYTFFYIYINAELPIGIPLFSTGLALYGMAGLFGYNIEPSKGKIPGGENETWYENPDGSPGWYLRDVSGITDTSKWIDNYESMAFGAGFTLGTLSDNGFTISAKTLIVLLIPGPIIIVEGKVNLLKERKKLLEETPLFRVLAVYDHRAGTFLMNIEANYALPEKDSGKVLNIRALAEAFFNFNDPAKLHLYIGQDQPTEKRIRAKILSLFEANAYFMLDSNRLAMGAWVGYDNEWQFGPLRVILEAWMEGRAEITFKPPQATGSMTLQGRVGLSVFGFSIGLSVGAGVEVQAPNPFLVHVELYIKLDLPWPFPDPEAHVVLEWKEEVPPPIPMPLAGFGIEHLKVTEKWSLEKYPLYDSNADGFWDENPNPIGEPNDAHSKSPVVPLDAKPVIVFAKPVEDAAKIGDDPKDSDRYEYKYRLLNVTLEKRPKTGGAWVKVAVRSQSSNEKYGELYGKWQAVSDGGQQVNAKLMLWGRTSFSISRESENNVIWHNYIKDVYDPCAIDTKFKVVCIDFEDKEPKTYLPVVFVKDGAIFYGQSQSQVVRYTALWAGTNNALDLIGVPPAIDIMTHVPQSAMFVVFPETVGKVDIFLGKGTSMTVTTFSEGLQPCETRQVYIPSNTPDVDMKPVTFYECPIRALSLSPVERGLISKICYVTTKEIKRGIDSIALWGHIKETTKLHWKEHKENIFEPDMYYKLTAVTEAIRNNDHFQFEEHAYFQTEKPPGSYLLSNVREGEHYPTAGPLKDLSAYINKTIPKVGEKPVYRAYDIGVIFNESYVEQMYLMANLPLAIQLFDNNDKPVVDTDGKEVVLENQWGDNPQIFLTRDEKQWIAVMQGCAEINYTEKYRTRNLYSGHKNMVLKSETFYKAKVIAGREPTKYVVYQFSFITSKYATFIHQIHSFRDVAWSLGKLSGLSDSLLNKAILEGILAGINPGNPHQPEIEAKKFEQITELFKLGIRQLPSSLEVLALDDNSECYGFLIESPEPIDWKRVTMSVSYSSSNPLVEEASEPIKIIGASISQSGVGTACNNEWVDILLREPFDINGLVVEHKSEGGNDFQRYILFSSEKLLPAGTIIRTHSGKEEDDTGFSPEIEHRYLSLNTWQFKSMGETLRLKDAQGKVLHARYIAKAGSFSSKGAICIRNADNTRAFVFYPGSGENASKIEKGNYRFDLRFKRNTGGDQPVLKRMGGDSDEETDIEFSYPAILPGCITVGGFFMRKI